MSNIVSKTKVDLEDYTLLRKVVSPGYIENLQFGGMPVPTDIAPGQTNDRWVDGEFVVFDGTQARDADIHFRKTNIYSLMLGRSIVTYTNNTTGAKSLPKELFNTASNNSVGLNKYPVNCTLTRECPDGGESICFVTSKNTPYRFFTHKITPDNPATFNYAVLADRYSQALVYVAKGSVVKNNKIINTNEFTVNNGTETYTSDQEAFIVVFYKSD